MTFSVCCNPEIVLPWQRDVTPSALYCFCPLKYHVTLLLFHDPKACGKWWLVSTIRSISLKYFSHLKSKGCLSKILGNVQMCVKMYQCVSDDSKRYFKMITIFGSFFSSGPPKFNTVVVLLPCPLNPEIINSLACIHTALGQQLFHLLTELNKTPKAKLCYSRVSLARR